MNKMLVFDMDGTIADFYKVDGWLKYLDAADTYPYEAAAPIFNMAKLRDCLMVLKGKGWRVAITSWASKDADADFRKAIKKAKTDWLKAYGFPYDEIHVVAYGTNKTGVTAKKGGVQILFDDELDNRLKWSLGDAVNPTRTNILEYLHKLAEEG